MKLMNLGIPMMSIMSIALVAHAKSDVRSKEESKLSPKYEIYDFSYSRLLDQSSDLETAIKHFKTLKDSGQCGIDPLKLIDKECIIRLESTDAYPQGYYVISMGRNLTQLSVAPTFDKALEALAKLQENGFCGAPQDYGMDCHFQGFDASGRDGIAPSNPTGAPVATPNPGNSNDSYHPSPVSPPFDGHSKTWRCTFTPYSGTGMSERDARTALKSSCMMQGMPANSCEGYANAASCAANE